MEYGCIGEHLGHSFSKEIHNALADYQYELKELSPQEVEMFLKSRSFKAINVTIPYKLTVMPFLDFISDEAKSINAVNTIVNKDGKLYGYNTDFYGLKSLIERSGTSLNGKKVAVLGSGGTSNTAFVVAQSLGAASVLKVSRSPRENYITYSELYDLHSDIEVVINTTPCGMFPDIGEAAIDLNKLPCVQAVFDAVYNPLSSQLILDAKKKGITAVGGLYMLVSQAAYAVEKFIATPVDETKIEQVFQRLYKSKMNVVLIGMPSCGKTTIGKQLSAKLSKAFVDTDELIVEEDGRQIPEIFSEDGEAFFRKLEASACIEASKQSSKVIATGGGVVLNEANINALKANGRVYFIDRPLNELCATSDRPLSSSAEALEKRYNERYPLYKSLADVVVDGSGTVEEVIKRIEVDFYGYSCN
jgi:shikimate dehydrogenase